MLRRILLSIFSMVLLFSFTNCGFSNLLGTNDKNSLVHENFLLTIDNSKKAIQGQQIDIDISLYNFSEENYQVGGFDLMVAYDPNVLQLDTVETGQFIEYCGWFYYTFRNQIDTIDNKIIGTIRITAISDHYFADPICLTPTDSSTNQITRLKFIVKNNRQYVGKTTPIQFFWKDCGDNMLVDIDGFQLIASNNIYTKSEDLTANQPYPNFTGYNNSCDSLVNAGRPVPIRIIDFINGEIKITAE